MMPNSLTPTRRESSDETEATPPQSVARPQPEGGAPRPDAEYEMMECPLHTAMRHVAVAAVAQHVLYAEEGDYHPREGLLQEMQGWLRVHELVRAGICPATRTSADSESGALEEAALDIALAGIPVQMRTGVAAAIRVCGRRSRGDGCPLDAAPFESCME